MGTLALRRFVCVVSALVTLLPYAAHAGQGRAQAPPAAPVISGGHDGASAWMVGRHRQLKVTKRFDAHARTVAVDLEAPNDRVHLAVAADRVAVTRQGRSIVLDSAEALAAVQQLLGGSPAVVLLRELLSQFESESALHAPDMSLLSTAAFVASLVGDSHAPRRLSDRFVAKHRGFFRQVNGSGGATCWQEYTVEVTNAWDDLQNCMDEADQDVWWWSPFRRVACNGVWLMRSESAWFEYLKCLSPMSTLQP